MGNKMATRDAYGKALAEFAEQYDLYVFDADLAAATKTGTLKDAYPDRFFDCGMINFMIPLDSLAALDFDDVSLKLQSL